MPNLPASHVPAPLPTWPCTQISINGCNRSLHSSLIPPQPRGRMRWNGNGPRRLVFVTLRAEPTIGNMWQRTSPYAADGHNPPSAKSLCAPECSRLSGRAELSRIQFRKSIFQNRLLKFTHKRKRAGLADPPSIELAAGNLRASAAPRNKSNKT
jgi:hypothetical protein